MFNRRAIFRAGVAACLACAWLAPMIWGVRQISRRVQRENALEVLRANGVIETIYDFAIAEDGSDEFSDARLADAMIWSKAGRPETTIFDRIKKNFSKEEYYQTHLTVPQGLISLVPNLRDLFSEDELTIVSDCQSPASAP